MREAVIIQIKRECLKDDKPITSKWKDVVNEIYGIEKKK